MEKNMLFIGIDPGMNGGVAGIEVNGKEEETRAFRCPKTPDDMHIGLRALIGDIESYDLVKVYAECVWAFPTDARSSAFRFGFNYGVWNGILAALELDVREVAPKTWMNHYDMLPNMEKKERKRWLKDTAIGLFPNLKVTFNISDALLIANYGKEIYIKEQIKLQRKNK